MEFVWDDAKREANIAKHGIDFLRAQFLFDGRPVITASSSRSDEERFATTGKIDDWFVTAIWTRRGEAVRFISARRARHAEKQRYLALLGKAD